MIDIFKTISHYNNNKITGVRFFFPCKMIVSNLEITNRIWLYMFLSTMIIMVANGSSDKTSVLNKCQNMEDCPAGKICESYDHMKYSSDFMVRAEILLR